MDELTITPFSVHTLDLSMEDKDLMPWQDPSSATGGYLQANYYTVPGIVDDNGNLRQLSIGQLVMAICLEQAVQIEAQVVDKMAEMANTIVKMEVLTGIQEVIANNPDSDGNLTLDHNDYHISSWPGIEQPCNDPATWDEVLDFLTLKKYGPICSEINANSSAEEVVSALSTALDDLNTVNQEEMIDLESLTNKRDQRYDLITNMLKSFNNVMTAIANNV